MGRIKKRFPKISLSSIVLIILLITLLVLVLLPFIISVIDIIKSVDIVILIIMLVLILLLFLIVMRLMKLKHFKEAKFKKIFVKSKLDLVLVLILAIILVGGIIFYVSKAHIGYGGYDYEPQNPQAYSKAIGNRTIYDFFERGLPPGEFVKEEVIKIESHNPGFELDNNKDGMPDGWYYYGMIKYVDNNCFEGSCMHIKADNSEYGFAMINSDSVRVIPNMTYSVSFNIYCVRCENTSAFLGIFWMGTTGRGVKELKRSVLELNTTEGYNPVSLFARAPEEAEYAIYGVRVHEEGARIMPRTELYIDGTQD